MFDFSKSFTKLIDAEDFHELESKPKMAMSTFSNTGMKGVIELMNEIQDLCTQMCTVLEFDLPQIAVVGLQSAGKSSVLEGFVGRWVFTFY